MLSFRPRWPDRMGAIVALAGMSVGMSVLFARYPLGVQLITWMVLLFVLVIPFVVLELGTGAIYQDPLAQSCRKATRHSEYIGWLAVIGAFLAAVFVVGRAGAFLHDAYDSLLSAIANQAGRWSGGETIAVANEGSIRDVIAVAIILAALQVRLWRGAPVIARFATTLAMIAVAGVALTCAIICLRPGAISGVAASFELGESGLAALQTLDPWVSAGTFLILVWVLGSGTITTFGSNCNRSSDAIGIGIVAVLAGTIAQIALAITVQIGSNIVTVGNASVNTDGIDHVAITLATSGWPIWWSSLLIAIWFISVGSLLVIALIALMEAVAAPIADKFKIQRERVVPGLCLLIFFATTAIGVVRDVPSWCETILLSLLIPVVVAQAFLAWRVMKLDAIARHLNAYSAFQLGLGWRICIAILVPLGFAGILVAFGLTLPAWWLIVAVLTSGLLVALVVSRLGTR